MFGKTRQAYYKQSKNKAETALKHEIVVEVVRKIRKKAKSTRWGVRKIHGLVNKELALMDIKIGRDALFDLLCAHGMLAGKRKRRYFTTQSHHWLRKYDNLIVGKVLKTPNQLWVCDITYVNPAYFLYLITDAYSQKIVGWHLSDNLKADSAVIALKKAISANKKRIKELIHHSDRGVQYCAKAYIDLLKSEHIAISMSNPGAPQENAIAERINGILKEEWLYDTTISSLESGRKQVKQIITIYNTYRPHTTLNNQTPVQIHDEGTARIPTKRVIGQTYTYRKKRAKSHTL